MDNSLHAWWARGLTAALAALYGWIGLAAHGLDRTLALTGALLIIAALILARTSRTVAAVLLVAGTVPLAVAAWWSIAAPLVGLLTLLLGQAAIRMPRPPHQPTGRQPQPPLDRHAVPHPTLPPC